MELLEKEWFIQAPWGRLSILAWGDCNDPPVLVCHGENDSAVSFRPLLRLLPKNFYYIGMELPGNGKSDRFPPGLPISLLDLVFALEVVRRHFRWQQFIYLSHSIATTIGRLYNVSYPGHMTKVVELDQITPMFGLGPENYAKWYDFFYTNFFDKYDVYNASKEKAPVYTWDQAIQKLVSRRKLSPECARATIERFSEPMPGGKIRFTIDQRMKLMTRPPFSEPQLKSIFVNCRTPTLAVMASNSIKRGLMDKTPYLMEEKDFDGTYRVRFVDGTHDVHVISPHLVAPYVRQFLLQGLEALDLKAKL